MKPLEPNDTLEMLAAHAADVKYVDSVEERALIAYEGFCMMVARPETFSRTAAQRDEDIQNYGRGRRILIQALKRGGADSGGVSSEPSEAAVEAAREASGEARGTPDNLLGRRVVLAVLRAAYAIDGVRDSGGVAPADKETK